MATYLNDVKTRAKNAAQTEPAREDQVKNHAGGYVFELDKWQHLERFLILGTAGGTYYTSQRKHTKENMDAVIACIAEDAKRVIDTIVAISDGGRAIKNEPAIVVLAMCLSEQFNDNELSRAESRKAVPKVCRIGTHIFQLAEYLQAFRGWGTGARKAIQAWFYAYDTPRLAYQAIKYPQREGWSMRDLLRLSHYSPNSERRKALMDYICGRETSIDGKEGLEQVMAASLLKMRSYSDNPKEAAELIVEHRLPREAVPTELLNEPVVWDALQKDMPMTALIRNLNKLSSIGLLTPNSQLERDIAQRLTHQDALKRARVHPLTILMAWATYKSGRGLRGSLTWPVAQRIVEALEDAYFKAFEFVVPSNKRFYLGLDVSGSMGMNLSNTPITCAAGAACMAAVTVSVEPSTYVAGFCSGGSGWRSTAMKPINLTKRSGLTGGIQVRAFGGTDCALPMLHAMEEGIEADVFVVYTDNETWAGKMHPFKALQRYRERTGIAAKLIVVGMTSTGFTIADPSDAGMLDVVGFDTATPQAISAFAS